MVRVTRWNTSNSNMVWYTSESNLTALCLTVIGSSLAVGGVLFYINILHCLVSCLRMVAYS